MSSGTTRPPSLTGQDRARDAGCASARAASRAPSGCDGPLWARRRRPCAAADEHQQEQDHLRLIAPELEIDAGEAGRRDDRHHLEAHCAGWRRDRPCPVAQQRTRPARASRRSRCRLYARNSSSCTSAVRLPRTARYCSAKLAPATNMKTVMIQSIAALWYRATDCGCGENPPAAMSRMCDRRASIERHARQHQRRRPARRVKARRSSRAQSPSDGVAG